MVAEHPQIARLADCEGLTPVGVDIILGIRGVLFEVGLQLIDLNRLETENGDVEPLRAQQTRQLWYLDRQALAIPPRVFCDLVVGDRKCTSFRRRKSGDNDDRHLRQTE